jgi:hypothetical protein
MRSPVTIKGQPIMKKYRLSFFLLCAVVCVGATLSSINCSSTGTMNGNLRVNISDQPVWGPTGYDHAEYYYIPDIDCYYSVSERQYIYREGSEWRYAATLPSSYSSYDPYHSYKVVVYEDKPYQNNGNHREKYKMFKGKKDQEVIRDSHEDKYFVNKDHPDHDKWVKKQGH